MIPSPVIVALDFSDLNSVLHFVKNIDPKSCRLKIGKALFTREGPALVRRLQDDGFEIFLDLKFHDIPNTVSEACKAAADLGVWMVNVHALGGEAMLAAAHDALAPLKQKPILIAVTVLTSFSQNDLARLGIRQALPELVLNLAQLAQSCGIDGVVCSAHEARALRAQCGKDFVLVTPGIRLAGGAQHDQQRIMTPEDAITAGSNYLVIGRPITQAIDPQMELKKIIAKFH